MSFPRNVYFMSANCLDAGYLITGNTIHFNKVKLDLVNLHKKLKIITPSQFIQRSRPSFEKQKKSVLELDPTKAGWIDRDEFNI